MIPLLATGQVKPHYLDHFLGQNAVVVGDKIYLIGGSEGVYTQFIGISNATYVYDPATDSWSTMSPIPVPVAYYASAVINNKIYIIGGGTENTGLNNATNIVQIFNPSTNEWTESAPILTGVFAAGSCTTTGLSAPERIYVVAGSLAYDWGGSATYSTAETETSLNQVYDPAAGTWSSAAPLPYKNSYFSLVNVEDTLYAVGGFDSNDVGIVTVEKYIPAGYIAASISPTPTAPEFSTLILPLVLVTISAIAATKLRQIKSRKRERRNAAETIKLKGPIKQFFIANSIDMRFSVPFLYFRHCRFGVILTD